MDINEEIFRVLQEAFTLGLAENYPTVPVIQAYQDAPAPEDTYIAIGFPSAQESGIPTYDSEVVESEPGVFTIGKTTNYEATIQVTQKGGNGEALRVALQSFYALFLRTFLCENNLTIYQSQSINFLPRTMNQNWVKEFVTELSIGFAVRSVEAREWIETVEITNNI